MRLALLSFSILLSVFIFNQTLFAQDKIPSKAYDLHISKGIIELEAKRYDIARDEFKKAKDERPDDPDANYLLGLTYLGLGELEKVEESLKKVIELDPAYPGAHYQLGVVYYKKGALKDSLAEFSLAEKGEPERGMIYYYQGLIYYKLSEYNKTPPLFLKAMSLIPDSKPMAHYYQAISYYKLGYLDDAEEGFKEVLRLEPGSDIARSSMEYLDEIKKAVRPKKRWDLSLSLCIQYDTNVVLEPADSLLASQIARNQDLREVAFFRGGYRFIQSDSWNLGANYSLYQGLHRKLDEFNTLSNDIGIYGYYAAGQHQLRLNYNFNLISVDNSRYLLSHTINPMINLFYSNRFITQLSYRYQAKDFQDTKQFPLNSERDGANHQAGLTEFISFKKIEGGLRGGYYFDHDQTDGPDWDYDGHRLFLGIGFPVILGTNLDLLAEYYPKIFKNPNSLTGFQEKRRDDLRSATISFSRELSRLLSVSLQFLTQQNDSNIDIFEYNRSIYSIMLQGRL